MVHQRRLELYREFIKVACPLSAQVVRRLNKLSQFGLNVSEEIEHDIFAPFDDQLDRAIAIVSHVTRYWETICNLFCRVSESHTLNPALKYPFFSYVGPFFHRAVFPSPARRGCDF
jgi:hypothetical protein